MKIYKTASTILLLLITIAFISCNGDSSTRSKGSKSSTLYPNSDWFNPIATQPTIPPGEDDNAGDGYEYCNLDYESGIMVGFCNNKIDSRKHEFKIKFGYSADGTNPTCVIPTSHDQYGNSVYIGAFNCMSHSAGEKRESYFNNLNSDQLNGALIMRKQSIAAYEACMHATTSQIPSCNGWEPPVPGDYNEQYNWLKIQGIPVAANPTLDWISRYAPSYICCHFMANEEFSDIAF